MNVTATHNIESSIRFHDLLNHFCDLIFLGDICDMYGTSFPFRANFADQSGQRLLGISFIATSKPSSAKRRAIALPIPRAEG
jgi:hypothetical protein